MCGKTAALPAAHAACVNNNSEQDAADRRCTRAAEVDASALGIMIREAGLCFEGHRSSSTVSCSFAVANSERLVAQSSSKTL